ncbi:MAG: trimethylamine methyltransferase family protein, partial [Alphaproteobacteria bacterium]|nr:trimethylamine methyltransferase family protein [Alphaproteobacteria bacterium]
NYETWKSEGANDTTRRATRVWRQLLDEYETPDMDPGIAEELTAFIRRRKQEGGATADD